MDYRENIKIIYTKQMTEFLENAENIDIGNNNKKKLTPHYLYSARY